MFKINIDRLTVWLTAIWLRFEHVMILALSFSWPLVQLYNDFIAFSDEVLYRLSHNSQVCYMEAVLNDAFDNQLRRIRIVDFETKMRLYFWPDVALRDVYFGEIFFYSDSSYGDSGVDFTVELPTGLSLNEYEMFQLHALVREYKLAGKQYNIIYV
jgi:hypothetical protein